MADEIKPNPLILEKDVAVPAPAPAPEPKPSK
jgi:hypothetical protein